MIKGMVSGTFDIFTHGHLDVVRQALIFCDELIIAVADNPGKTTWFNLDERLHMASSAIEELLTPRERSRVHIVSIRPNTFTVNVAYDMGAAVVVRGVRSSTDYEYERQLCAANMQVNPKVQTVLVMSRPDFSHISSSAVKEMCANEGGMAVAVDMVASTVMAQIQNKLPLLSCLRR